MRGTIQTSKAGGSGFFIGWLSYSDVIFYGKPCVFKSQNSYIIMMFFNNLMVECIVKYAEG